VEPFLINSAINSESELNLSQNMSDTVCAKTQ
jgi:hypothetical protein